MEILKFDPIFKSVIWGGTRIATFKGIASQGEHVGESWELSAMPGHESVVSQGRLKGATLPSLLAKHGNEIIGERLMKRFNGLFPLLIKFIDSSDDLSVQVHPNDALAAKRHNSLGKTEMWYSIAPAEGAYLYSGFNRALTPDEFRHQIDNNEIIGSLNKYYTRPGDVFFLPAGRVHSLGRGNLVLEIHETSDITYRIYDYDRRDAEGNPRQLHIEESIEALDFSDSEPVPPTNETGKTGQFTLLAQSAFFRTEIARIDGPVEVPLADRDSFTALIAIAGELTVNDGRGEISMQRGETVLVPASTAAITISGKGTVVSTYVP